jgi:hypothetical protein
MFGKNTQGALCLKAPSTQFIQYSKTIPENEIRIRSSLVCVQKE